MSGSGVIDCTNPLYQSCPSVFWQLISSVVPDAHVSRINTDGSETLLANSDQNGVFNLALDEVLSIGDSIRIEASGLEAISIYLDSSYLESKINLIPMFKLIEPIQKIEFPIFRLVDERSISNDSSVLIEVRAKHALNYEIKQSGDSVFMPLTLINDVAMIKLDTGSNLIIVKFNGLYDTIFLNMEVVYLPDSLLLENTYNVIVQSDSATIGARMYVNNNFIRHLRSLSDTIPLLNGRNTLKFSKFGYRDSIAIIDVQTSLDLSLQLFPIDYSSLDGEWVFDFPSFGKIQYRSNVTLMDSLRKSVVALRQYYNELHERGLIVKSRTFELNRISVEWSNIRFAAILDQVESLSIQNIYLLKTINDTSFTKIYFDNLTNIARYEPTAQKLSYNYVNFDNGSSPREALVVCKKQGPIIVNLLSEIDLLPNEEREIPFSQFYLDPDSIHNDLAFFIDYDSLAISVYSEDEFINFVADKCYSGTTKVVLIAVHDEIEIRDTVIINVSGPTPPLVGLSGPPVICAGDTIILSTITGYNYLWSSGQTTQSISVTHSGDYSVMVIDSNGCGNTSSIVNIEVLPSPIPVAIPNGLTMFCIGDSLLLSTALFNSYLWSNGDATQFTLVKSTGDYFLTVTDFNGCSGVSESLSIIVYDLPIVNLGPDTISYLPVSLDAGNPGSLYEWNTQVTSQTILVDTTGWYSVTVTDAQGCKSSDSVFIDILTSFIYLNETNQLKVYPNPNNGSFTISGEVSTLDKFKISVINSIGQLVFSSDPVEIAGRFDKTFLI